MLAAMKPLLFVFCLSAVCALDAPLATAQQPAPGVAGSGMGQGEARLTSRSDVRLAMESGGGTDRAAITELGERVGQRMAQIRQCYERTVAADPTVTETMRIRFRLRRRGNPNLRVLDAEHGHRSLHRCVLTALRRVNVRSLPRPAEATIRLEFGNTAAEGARRAAARAEVATQVTIEETGRGRFRSQGGTPDGRVRFEVRGRGRRSAAAITAAHRALLDALPGLMDCRRRCHRRTGSSAGDVRATMRVRPRARPSAQIRSTTLRWPRARPCVNRVLNAIQRRDPAARGALQVTITFSETEE